MFELDATAVSWLADVSVCVTALGGEPSGSSLRTCQREYKVPRAVKRKSTHLWMRAVLTDALSPTPREVSRQANSTRAMGATAL